VTPRQLAHLLDTGQLRFVMLGDLPAFSRSLGAEAAAQPIADWVRAHGALVDPRRWRPDTPASRRLAAWIVPMQLYDLRPEAPVVSEAEAQGARPAQVRQVAAVPERAGGVVEQFVGLPARPLRQQEFRHRDRRA